jgi:hypothetical protein
MSRIFFLLFYGSDDEAPRLLPSIAEPKQARLREQNEFAYPAAYPEAVDGSASRLVFRLSAWNAWWARQGSKWDPLI